MSQHQLPFVSVVRPIRNEARYIERSLSAVLKQEHPPVAPFARRIREALAEILGLDVARVGLSAKRGERLGAVGEGRAVACDVVALIERSA